MNSRSHTGMQRSMKDGKLTSGFSIKSLMEETPPKEGEFRPLPLGTRTAPAAASQPVNSIAANHLLYNLALSSLQETFLDSLRQGSVFYGQNHPAYGGGALSSSLPGFMTSLQPEVLRSRSELIQKHPVYPWMLGHPIKHHHSRSHTVLDFPHAVLSLHKPKRIRTAFSPRQLVQLEASFEHNPYVVGQERRDLATDLGLTETQVKVWFQNRRTKEKRGKSDTDDGIMVLTE